MKNMVHLAALHQSTTPSVNQLQNINGSSKHVMISCVNKKVIECNIFYTKLIQTEEYL